MEKIVYDRFDQLVMSTLIDEKCEQCIRRFTANGYGTICCPIDSKNKRLGIIQNNSGRLLACDAETKTTKNFRLKLEEVSSMIPELVNTRKQVVASIEQQANRKIERVLHNLRSINGQMTQTLSVQIPTELNRLQVRKLFSTVNSLVKKDVQKASKTLLKLFKQVAAFRAELTVYDMLTGQKTNLEPNDYRIYDLVMVVAHDFFADLNARNIFTNVDECYTRVHVDYESFKVALYYIFENATKYALDGNDIEINFAEKEDSLTVNITMTSIMIEPDEVDLIFEDGYSGQAARRLHKEGSGIGLYRAYQLFKLNGAELSVDPGRHAQYTSPTGISYAINLFSIHIPKQ